MDDLTFIVGTMRQGYNTEPNQLGFIPDTKIATYYMPQSQYVIQRNRHGVAVGYLLHGKCKPGGNLTIAQAIVDIDKRNLLFGQQMTNQLIERARSAGVRVITLRCAADLNSNEFWISQGFQLTGEDKSPNKRNRIVNLYSLYLWPTLFQSVKGE